MHQTSVTSDIIGKLRQTPGWLWVRTPGCLQELFFDRTGLTGGLAACKVFLIDETDGRVYGVGSLTEVSGELLYTALEYYVESPVYAPKDGKAGVMEPGEAERILDEIKPYAGKRTYLDYKPVSDLVEEVRDRNYNAGLMTDNMTLCFGTVIAVTEEGFMMNSADRWSRGVSLCCLDDFRGLKKGDLVKVKGRVTGYSLTKDPEDPEESVICRHITVHTLTVFSETGGEMVLRCSVPEEDKQNLLTGELLESLKNEADTLWLDVHCDNSLKAFSTDIDTDELEGIAEEITGKPQSADGLPDRVRVFMIAESDDLYAIGHLVKGPGDSYIAVADYITEAPIYGHWGSRWDRGNSRAKATAVLSELKAFAGKEPCRTGDRSYEDTRKASRYVRVKGVVTDVDDDVMYIMCGKDTVRCSLRDHQQEGNALFGRGDAVIAEGVTEDNYDIEVHNVITENI